MGKRFKGFLGVLFLAGCFIGLAVLPLTAQVTIPQGSHIDSAEFAIFVTNFSELETVTLYRITSGWDELGVNWNNFGSSWSEAVGSFANDIWGWRSVDLTSLVQAWVDGALPNHGFVMAQSAGTPYTNYASSENEILDHRPTLTVVYTTPAGTQQSAIIRRPGTVQAGVADTFISEQTPGYYTWGSDPILSTGNLNGFEKISLIRFSISVVPYDSPGTGTPGYWMNHPEAWPVSSITIGGRGYTMGEAIVIMKAPVVNDKTYTMFAALVAAKLNVMIGNDASCISAAIAAADAWIAPYRIGVDPVVAGGKNSPWRTGEPLYLILDNYNNGLLCAPPRY